MSGNVSDSALNIFLFGEFGAPVEEILVTKNKGSRGSLLVGDTGVVRPDLCGSKSSEAVTNTEKHHPRTARLQTIGTGIEVAFVSQVFNRRKPRRFLTHWRIT